MRLFIAEKPSVAKAIAEALGVTSKGDGYIECGTDKITWCFGHMLEQAEPDEYTPDNVPRNSKGKKVWRVDELPIIPTDWLLKPKDDARRQLAIIGKLIKEGDEIVNAGDPDREGQLLVDEVLQHFDPHKPARRFWVFAQDKVSVRRGLDALKDNRNYQGWADAARGRARADWLIGMNLSRAYTLRAQRGGSRALLTVGRVQTPTLALVVSRDREIEAFKPIPYYTIHADVWHADDTFRAVWQPGEAQPGLDDAGRLIDSAVADSLVTRIEGQAGEITDYKQEAKKQGQPLAYSLSDITALASAKYGYSAEDVLNVCQALYETHKLTSYPRTDCPYLPESQHADAPNILGAVKHVNPDLANLIDDADPGIKSKTWNDDKITAHHGIAPTMQKGNRDRLTEQEQNIYQWIVRAYVAQFYPVHEYRQTTVYTTAAGEIFTAKGRVITRNGWRDVYQSNTDKDTRKQDEDDQSLPAMKPGDAVTCVDAGRRDLKTKAPARFTEGTLIRAMEQIHKLISDPEHKKMLREGDGIGTSATRASIIAELKRREFLATKGKQIISTTIGRSMIDALPDVVKSPLLTALYERMLKNIELGQGNLNTFIAKQEKFIREQVAKANLGTVSIAGAKTAALVSTLHKCMSCGAGLSRRPTKKKGHYCWGCSNFPSCKQTYPDLKGRPDYSKGRNGAPSAPNNKRSKQS